MKSILDADSIQFKWSMMDVDIPDHGQSKQLLIDIVEKSITILGFSYESRILEAYKVAKGCTLAKAKALRKGMQASRNKQWVSVCVLFYSSMQSSEYKGQNVS